MAQLADFGWHPVSRGSAVRHDRAAAPGRTIDVAECVPRINQSPEARGCVMGLAHRLYNKPRRSQRSIAGMARTIVHLEASGRCRSCETGCGSSRSRSRSVLRSAGGSGFSDEVARPAYRIAIDPGHPWRPPFGLDRVGRPAVIVVQASASGPTRRGTSSRPSRSGKARSAAIRSGSRPNPPTPSA